MRRRVDRMENIRAKAYRMRGSTHWPHAVFEPAMQRRGHQVAMSCEDRPPRMTLARRLERDPRLPARAASWLFIKGGMVVLLVLGLMVLGLIGVFR
jgi:hypothetical protein